MKDNTYNGWTNYETWVWNLWINNEQETYSYWVARARALEGAEAVHNLADQMQADCNEAVEAFIGERTGALVDILRAGVSEINWREVAQSLLESG